MIKKIIKKVAKTLGYNITKIKQNPIQKVPDTFSMQSALERCLKRGLVVNTVIDVGASDGRWSKECMRIFPKVSYFLVEGQKEHKNGLSKLKKENPNVEYVIAAAGKNEGNIYFDEGNLFGGLASETPLDNNCIKVPVIILDNEIKKRNLEPPYLLKLDTHGFEVPILEGSINILKSAQLVIIETYNYKLTNDSLKYYEMCNYMEKLGFSPIEMVDFMQRKHDNSFWQMDTFFIPSNSKEFSYNSYI